MDKPLIGITGPSRGAFGPRILVALAVWWYGGKPLQLRPGDEIKNQNYHGIVVTGGHDVEPVLYAAEPEVEANYDSERDAFESAIINKALERHLPLLGICRGAQLLNVCKGGSLYQSLHDHRKKTSSRWTIFPLKTLCMEEKLSDQESKLASIFKKKSHKINSLHNQAIDELGEGLMVCGRDLDHIVQGIEDPSREFLVGVQWHPEYLLYLKAQRSLFKELVRVAGGVPRG